MMNALAKQAEDKIEEAITPASRDAYERIVKAGMTVVLNKGRDGALASIKDSKDPVSDVVKGVIGVVSLLRKQSKGTMPEVPMVYAAMTLILHGLDFADKLGVLILDNETLEKATELFADTMLPVIGIQKEHVAQMGQRLEKIMADPASAEKLRQAQAKEEAANSKSGAPPAVPPAAPEAPAAPPAVPPMGGV